MPRDKLDKETLQRLKNNDPTLRELYLANNEISAAGANDLAAMLKDNRTLTTLDLSWNQIGDAGAKDLAAMLKDNRTLTTLDLSNNEISDAGAKDLAASLKDNRALTALEFSNNEIGDKIEKEIDVLLARNETLAKQFLQAITKGDLGQAKALQQQGVSILATDNLGNTALHLAAREGHIALVQWLLESLHTENRAVLSQKNKQEKTASELTTSPAIIDYLKKASQPPLSTSISISNPSVAVAKQSLPQFKPAPALMKPSPFSSPSSNSNILGTLFAPQIKNSSITGTSAKNSEVKSSSSNIPFIPYNELEFDYKNKLGVGGGGIVFGGSYSHKQVAIKMLTANDLSDESLQEFYNEASIMMQSYHPNIISCYGTSIDEKNHHYIIMELMVNGSLTSYIRRSIQGKKSLMPDNQFKISVDITKGLAFLHQKKIIHRDLKTDNVLLDGNLNAKLGDFGLAKIKEESEASTTAGVGTAGWLAPELILQYTEKGNVRHTNKSDMFAYALVLWSLWSREKPLKNERNRSNVNALFSQGKREDIPAGCPPLLAELITTCWAANPEDRLTADQALLKLVNDPEVTNAPRLR